MGASYSSSTESVFAIHVAACAFASAREASGKLFSTRRRPLIEVYLPPHLGPVVSSASPLIYGAETVSKNGFTSLSSYLAAKHLSFTVLTGGGIQVRRNPGGIQVLYGGG